MMQKIETNMTKTRYFVVSKYWLDNNWVFFSPVEMSNKEITLLPDNDDEDGHVCEILDTGTRNTT